MSESYNVYVDESSQTKSRYLIIGGVILRASEEPEILARLSAARLPDLPKGELKWGKVSRAKLEAYKRVCDVLFQYDRLHYYCVVVDRQKQRHEDFNGGSSDVGFNKEIYQLANKLAKHYTSGPFNLYLDQRSTNNTPEELRIILNRGRARAGDARRHPFRRCQFLCSKSTPMLALPDLMNGALAYRLNARDTAEGASSSKQDLCRHILGRASVQNPFQDTAVTGKFCIWHRRLR
ncbi:DUF3800 domain-containing protein [Paracoccus sp. MA]|uniref:DUF3800 domain-containing protein n=1 Tax=Paracoccus sp. MA TaxID=2895796 RepID=UPI001E5D7266|nr:DUF3800 domain-containing protein [Paracoccus sp. MA]UFM63657.1 DUF3800 domain-containing protein [Paracoccus sp. MA]